MTTNNNYDYNSDSSSEYEPEYEPEIVTISDYCNGVEISEKFSILSLVPPPLEFMVSLHTEEKEISGRQVWCGSVLLAHYLFKHRYSIFSSSSSSSSSASSVLELGAGTGLVGMLVDHILTTASSEKEKDDDNNEKKNCFIALTDGDPEALDLLEQNLKNEDNKINLNTTISTELFWGDETSENDFISICQQQQQKQQKSPHQLEDPSPVAVKFDIILAGDVLYKDDLPELFLKTVRTFLNPENGVLYLCHVPRANVTQETVKDALFSAGFHVEKEVDFANEFLLEQQNLLSSSSSLKDIPMEDIERAKIYKITFSC